MYPIIVLMFVCQVLCINPLLIHSTSTSPIRSSTLLDFLQNDINVDNSYLILKKEELNLNSMNSLNLKDLKSIRIQNENIIVPNNFKSVFLFNHDFSKNMKTTSSPFFKFDNSNNNLTEFLNNSPPFIIPNVNFYDLNLLIPKVPNLNSHNPLIKENVPLLVFYLRDSNDVEINDGDDHGGKVKTNEINLLEFDSLTKNWFKDLSINQLVESFFCNSNNEICTKIDLNNSKILIFSIWEEKQLVLPLSVLLNDESIPRSKSYKQIMQNYRNLRNLNKRSRTVDVDGSENSFDDLKYKLEQRLKQKRLKNDKQIALKSKLSKTKFEKEDPESYDGSYLTSKIKTNTKNNKLRLGNTFNAFNKEKEQIEEYRDLRSKNTIDKIKLISTRVDKKTKDKAAEQRKDCEPITWFNVFHHSIFKNVNFCL